MPYLSFISGAEGQGTPPQALIDAVDQYVTESLKNGTMISAGGLAPSAAGVRVEIRKGRVSVVDGPFSESKEVVGGYSVVTGMTREEVIRVTREFMQLHVDHWPEWEGVCELRELVFLAP